MNLYGLRLTTRSVCYVFYITGLFRTQKTLWDCGHSTRLRVKRAMLTRGERPDRDSYNDSVRTLAGLPLARVLYPTIGNDYKCTSFLAGSIRGISALIRKVGRNGPSTIVVCFGECTQRTYAYTRVGCQKNFKRLCRYGKRGQIRGILFNCTLEIYCNNRISFLVPLRRRINVFQRLFVLCFNRSCKTRRLFYRVGKRCIRFCTSPIRTGSTARAHRRNLRLGFSAPSQYFKNKFSSTFP